MCFTAVTCSPPRRRWQGSRKETGREAGNRQHEAKCLDKQIDRQTDRETANHFSFFPLGCSLRLLARWLIRCSGDRERGRADTDCDTDAVVQGCQFWAISVATHISFGQLSKQWQRDAPSLLPPVSDAIASRDLSRNATESISKLARNDALAGSLHSMAHAIV